MPYAEQQSIIWSQETGSRYESSDFGSLTSLESERIRDWRDAWNCLLDLSILEDDWDGAGAEAPSIDLMVSAIDLCKILNEDKFPAPSVVASPNGTIVFSWQLPNSYLEIDVTKPGYAEYMLEVPEGKTLHWEQSWSTKDRATTDTATSSINVQTEREYAAAVGF